MFDSVGFSEVAKDLIERPVDPEARSRTAIGRAYYGLFLASRAAIARSAGKPIDSNVGHGELTNALFSTEIPDLVTLATTLQSLYQARQKADYILDLDAVWQKRIARPASALTYVRRCEAALRQLPALDFSPVARALQ